MHNRGCYAMCAAPSAAMLKKDGGGGPSDDKEDDDDDDDAHTKKKKKKKVEEQFTCGALTVGSSSGPMGAYQVREVDRHLPPP